MNESIGRRHFMGGMLASAAGAAGIGNSFGSEPLPDYEGPNVVIIRFGGGVRRRETIDPEHTYAPFLCKELARRGTLYPNMVIDQFQDINTSHGEGTLYILTGKYEKFSDVGGKFLGTRFESKVPTLFEYLRKTYAVPEHQTLIINGEDRTDEEFYSFSNHHLFGANFRSETLSLYRFKVFLLRRQIAEGKFAGEELVKKRAELAKMEALDYRSQAKRQAPEIEGFWEKWREFYGESGFVNPRGDRLLTELGSWSLKHLRPKLMMINYNDPDYVHWGNMSFYTRGISVIDEGLRQLVSQVENDPGYRDNTIFVVVPDCGRDTNPLAPVPCQHHFNSKSAREIWALVTGPGVAAGQVVDRQVDQTSVAKTVGELMGAPAKFAEGDVLEEVFA